MKVLPISQKIDLFITEDQKIELHARPHPFRNTKYRENTGGSVLDDVYSNTISIHTGSSRLRKRARTALISKPTENSSNSLNNSKDFDEPIGGKVLSFSPKDGKFELDTILDEYGPTMSKYVQELTIFGVVGLLDLSFGKYLIYIAEREAVASIGDKVIYKVVKGGFVTVSRRAYITLSEEQQEKDSLKGILEVLESGLLYFSYEYELTNNSKKFIEKISSAGSSFEREQESIHEMTELCDENFWWNRSLQLPFIESEFDCHEFIVPLIAGFVSHFPTSIQPSSDDPSDTSEMSRELLDVYLISRIHRKRVGTRYTRRGLDIHGYAAMHVETELIIRKQDRVCSYIVARGSLPWLWKQEVDFIHYKPEIVCEPRNSIRAKRAFKKHFDIMKSSHGTPVVAINLLDKRGYEKEICNLYHASYLDVRHSDPEIMEGIEYHGFDLNCSNKLDEFSNMFEVVKAAVDKHDITVAQVSYPDSNSYTSSHSSRAFKPVTSGIGESSSARSSVQNPAISLARKQTGVFRVNCLDCLDRTNMIQFLIASRAFLKMLYLMNADFSNIMKGPSNIFETKGESSFHISDIENLIGSDGLCDFRNIWIRNGNALANYYTGTSALNSIFIETGIFGECVPEARVMRLQSSLIAGIPALNINTKFWSKILDGRAAIGRFYLNNMADSYKQDAFDSFLCYHRGTLDSQIMQESSKRDIVYRRVDLSNWSRIHQKLSRRTSWRILNEMQLDKTSNSRDGQIVRTRPVSVPEFSDIAIFLSDISNPFRIIHYLLLRTWFYFSSTITIYLSLALRHMAPRGLNTAWDWFSALYIWLSILWIWRITCLPILKKNDLAAERSKLQVLTGSEVETPAVEIKSGWRWRAPKSGIEAWEGDDYPLKSSD